MKWLVLVFVLGMPLSVQAEYPTVSGSVLQIYKNKDKTLPPYWMRFLFYAHGDADHVRANMQFYVHRTQGVEDVVKGHCVFWVNHTPINGRDYLVFGDHGAELWFPHLTQEEVVYLNVYWEENAPLSYATIKVQSDHKEYFDLWTTRKASADLRKLRPAEHALHYRQLSLDEVCDTYTLEAAEDRQGD